MMGGGVPRRGLGARIRTNSGSLQCRVGLLCHFSYLQALEALGTARKMHHNVLLLHFTAGDN